MPHGGKRNGSGRKTGAATRRTRAIADKEAASGKIMPLEVMLEAMRAHYDAGRLDEAAEIAQHAAPYLHPRLSAVTVKGDTEAPVRLVETLVIVDGSPDPQPAA